MCTSLAWQSICIHYYTSLGTWLKSINGLLLRSSEVTESVRTLQTCLHQNHTTPYRHNCESNMPLRRKWWWWMVRLFAPSVNKLLAPALPLVPPHKNLIKDCFAQTSHSSKNELTVPGFEPQIFKYHTVITHRQTQQGNWTPEFLHYYCIYSVLLLCLCKKQIIWYTMNPCCMRNSGLICMQTDFSGVRFDLATEFNRLSWN